MKWSLLLALALGACSGTAPQPAETPVARTAALDSATVRQLCAKPDSVLVGRANCELRDQRQPITVFPKPPAEHPQSN